LIASASISWFCHHEFCPTFYVIREQANTKFRNVGTETRKHLFAEMSKKGYENTCLIVHNLSHHSPRSYPYVKHSNKFFQRGIVVKDIKKKKLRKKFFTFDIFGKGVFHGNITMTNLIHIGIYLKYKKFIFAGVDLHNSKYFWLKDRYTRSNIKRTGKNNKNRHPAASNTVSLLKMIKSNFNIDMSTLNKKSYLVKIMPYKEL